MPVQPGLRAKVELVVSESDTAISMNTGEVPVLATPRVATLCEQAAFAAVAGAVGPGQTTVGMKIQLDHLAPSAIGNRVVAEAVVEKVAGRRVMFTVSVNDERGLIAAGRITRVIVDTEQFLAKAAGTV